MRSIRSLIAVLLAVASFVPTVASASCGAEGCPLVRDGFGVTPSRFAFDVRYQDVTQDRLWNGTGEVALNDVLAGAYAAGHGEVELYTRTRSWVGEGRARINDRLSVTGTLPYMEREHRHYLAHTATTPLNPLFLDRWKFQGLGDATVLGHFRVLTLAGGTSMTVQGGVKLPTGRTHLPDEVRETGYPNIESTLEPSARPGSGSTDWLAGAFVSQRLPWKRALPLSASVLARWNGSGTDEFKIGNEVQAGLSGGYAPLAWMTLLAQINYSGHGTDVSADASEAAHTGMRSLYVTPGVTMRVSPAVSLYGLFQMRAWGRSDEATVVANDHFVIGTTYAIGR